MRKIVGLWIGACLLFCLAPVFGQDKLDTGTISRESVEARLKQLKTGREQALINLQAFDVAIQEEQHWLDDMTVAEKAKQKEPNKADPPEKATTSSKEVFKGAAPATAKEKDKREK
jgi:hypothetical protein